MSGISTWNLGCFSFLSLPASLGLLSGFSKQVERHVFAWRMASSLEEGGIEEEREECIDREGILCLWEAFGLMKKRWQ